MANSIIPRDKVFISGHRGLVGSALWRYFTSAGFSNLVGATSKELNLTDIEQTLDFFSLNKPNVV
ncbi:MAG: NAD-dependent epimerase/dehydratase family protein, partial [Candidatus Nanopelagicaceae bacterium]